METRGNEIRLCRSDALHTDHRRRADPDSGQRRRVRGRLGISAGTVADVAAERGAGSLQPLRLGLPPALRAAPDPGANSRCHRRKRARQRRRARGRGRRAVWSRRNLGPAHAPRRRLRGLCADEEARPDRRPPAARAPARGHRATSPPRRHGVLVLRTDDGDLVLDNLRDRVLDWRRTGYRFLRMQDPRHPRGWITVLAGPS